MSSSRVKQTSVVTGIAKTKQTCLLPGVANNAKCNLIKADLISDDSMV